MKNNGQNKSRRIGYLILVIAITAVLLTMSTYAWFSTQRDVTINGLEGKVAVAEGLEISLNAADWGQVIDLKDADLTNSANPNNKTYVTYNGNKNYIPLSNILAPVSTTGTEFVTQSVSGTNYNKGLKFFNGLATSKELKGVAETNEENSSDGTLKDYDAGYAGYYSFDILLRNTTRGTDDDKLQITKDSICQILKSSESDTNSEKTGLQNSIRVAFALYDGDADYTDEATDVISKTTATTSSISKVAIWEPNANYHVDYTKKFFSKTTPKIKINSTIKGIIDNYTNLGVNGVTTNTDYTLADSDATLRLGSQVILPTYALTAASVGKTIPDVYDYAANSAGTYYKMQNTLKTPITFATATATTPTDYNMVSKAYTDRQLVLASDGTTAFAIPANKVVRVKVYAWIEGQDIDCIANASHGNGIKLDFGLEKQATATTTNI